MIQNMMGIKVDFLQCFINFCDSGIKSENISNKELSEELHKPIIGKFNKRNVHSHFR